MQKNIQKNVQEKKSLLLLRCQTSLYFLFNFILIVQIFMLNIILGYTKGILDF